MRGHNVFGKKKRTGKRGREPFDNARHDGGKSNTYSLAQTNFSTLRRLLICGDPPKVSPSGNSRASS